MEELLKQILNEVSSLKDGQKQIINRLDSMETKMGKLAENQHQDVVAVIELNNKKLDHVVNRIDRMAMDVTFIARKVLEHETDIQEIKKA